MRAVLIFILLLSQSVVYGQKHWEGEVKDSDGVPLQGAHIENLNSGSHAHSSDFGRFKLERTEPGDVVEVRFIGKETKTIALNDLQNKTIVLQDQALRLSEIILNQDVDALRLMGDVDLKITPVQNGQEVLMQMPGLFIGQHAGGGKAEQIFLRGFDIDHGTDLAVSVDNVPVNMVSHAHGQGYADLHFLIPELITKMEYGKGPHETSVGNFGTAGFINIRTKDRLKKSSVSMEQGSFNTRRMVGLFNLKADNSKQSAYVAVEHRLTDGPFESNQNFYRTNAVAKYVNRVSSKQKLTLTANYFTSRWNASGQIPVRAVQSGLISRFGAIDDTEGGETSRKSLQLQWFSQLNANTYLKSQVYYVDYDFQLFSNFTFFLEDSVNGDQIMQIENRNLFGTNTTVTHRKEWGELSLTTTAGFGYRQDRSLGNELSKTMNRTITQYIIQQGDVYETNTSAFLQLSFNRNKWRLEPGIRWDEFDFQYIDATAVKYQQLAAKSSIVSPKIRASYTLSKVQFFAKVGNGFHSNDTRTILFDKVQDALPMAFGQDIGFIFKNQNFMGNLTLWNLDLDQEFVYVGDAGIVEPSGATRRKGVDLGFRYQFNNALFVRADGTHTIARSLEANEGEAYIPLAPKNAASFALGWNDNKKWSGAIRGRFMGNRPADESNEIIAQGYTVLDMNMQYVVSRITLSMNIQNVLNTNWNETQFLTESRLQNEKNSVEEIHYTPGTPFYFQLGVKYSL